VKSKPCKRTTLKKNESATQLETKSEKNKEESLQNITKIPLATKKIKSNIFLYSFHARWLYHNPNESKHLWLFQATKELNVTSKNDKIYKYVSYIKSKIILL